MNIPDDVSQPEDGQQDAQVRAVLDEQFGTDRVDTVGRFAAPTPVERTAAAYPLGDPVAELAAKWETATEMSSGRLSIITQAFASELRTAMGESHTVALALYSIALDEIHRLRAALAYEAGGIGSHLSYATFPKSRRPIAEKQVTRMQAAARGESQAAYAGVNSGVLRSSLSDAGAPTTLTRAQFEEQAAPPRGRGDA